MRGFHFGIDLNPVQPLQGWVLLPSTQGRRRCANPGLYDCNPFRVALLWRRGSLLHRRPEVDGYREGTGARACAGYLSRCDGYREGTAARDSGGYHGDAL